MNDILAKIEKLLAMTSSDSEAESAAALRLAQKLANENDIDLATVRSGSSGNEQAFCRQDIEQGGRRASWEKYVTGILLEFFHVRIVALRDRRDGCSSIALIGSVADVALARWVYEFLSGAFVRLWRDYQRREGVGVRHRESYYRGLFRGLTIKLEAGKQENRDAFTAATGGDYELMIASKDARLEAWLKDAFDNLRKGRTNKLGEIEHPEAFLSGREDGRSLEIFKPLDTSESRGLVLGFGAA